MPARFRLCRPFAPLSALALLSACVGTSLPPADPPAAPAAVTTPRVAGAKPVACAPRVWQKLVGTPVDQARLPRGLTHRVIRANGLVPTDYDDDRLNLIVNERRVIVAATCG